VAFKTLGILCLTHGVLARVEKRVEELTRAARGGLSQALHDLSEEIVLAEQWNQVGDKPRIGIGTRRLWPCPRASSERSRSSRPAT